VSFAKALRSDFPASIIVFLVALPLCMGIAIASGAPPATGLITGIVGGIFVGLIAGSPLQVSGPAAGLFVLVADVIAKFSQVEGGEPDLTRGLAAMGLAVLGAGVIQFVAGLLKLGNFFRAVSPAVIQGMLSGIGVLILASQFHVMVHDKNAADPLIKTWGKGLANLITIPQSLWLGIVPLDGSPHHLAAAIGLGTILILAFWKLIPIKSLHVIPAPVVAVLTASIAAYFLGLTVKPADLPKTKPPVVAAANSPDSSQGTDNQATDSQSTGNQATGNQATGNQQAAGQTPTQRPKPNVGKDGRVKIDQVEVPDNLTDGITLPTWAMTKELFSTALLVSALTIALVASAETMLCATAVDQMQTHCRTDYDRELAAQGVGNMICGVLGALPMTGVIVRSSANVDAGGQTRLSAILHGVWLLIFVALLPWVLQYIPMAALAAVLVFTGWKLINYRAIINLWKVGYAEGVICLLTLGLVVGRDLLTGVLVGIACTAARLLFQFARLDVRVDGDVENHRVEFHLNGAATFLALPKLTAMLDEVEPQTELHVHLENLTYVDHACLELFVNWEKQHEASGGKLVMDWDDLTATFKSASSRSSDRHAARAGADKAGPTVEMGNRDDGTN